MARISSLLLCITFGCTLLLAQSDPVIKNWKMDTLAMNSGQVFKGLFVEQNVKYLVFKTIDKKVDSPLRISTITVERKDVDSVVRITPKERALLETQLKELTNSPVANQPIVKTPLPDLYKNMELVPLIGNTEPPRIREGGPSYFSISPNANRVFLGEASEKSYLKLRKATLIEGNETTGRIKDAVYYLGKLHTGTDSGNIATWGKHGVLENNYKAIDSAIRLMVPIQSDLLVFDKNWQFHRCDTRTQTKVSFEKIANLPLKDVGQSMKYVVSKHGKNNLAVWDLTQGTFLYSLNIGEEFDYLVAPEENYLAVVKNAEVDIYNPATGKKLLKTIDLDPGSYCTFASVIINDQLEMRQGYAMIIKQNGDDWYFDFNNSKKYRNPTIPQFYKGDLVEVEKEIVKEVSVEPGVTGNSKAIRKLDPNYARAAIYEKTVYVFNALNRVEKIKRSRPLVQYQNIHAPYLSPMGRLDLTSSYKVDNQLHCEIVPTSTTLFLDEKIAYCSGDKYFHLLGGFRGNFKVERGTYFNIGNVCLNNTGSKMAHSANKDVCYVWDTEKKAKAGTIYGDGSPTRSLALSGDGKALLTCHTSGNVIYWDIENGGKEAQRFVIKDNPQKAFLSHDGTKLLLHAKSDKAYFLPRDKTPASLPDLELENDLKCVPLDEQGILKLMAFKAFTWKPNWDPNIEENDPEESKRNHPLFSPNNLINQTNHGVPDNQDQFLSMNQDGTRAVSLLDMNTVAIWDLAAGKQLFKLDHDNPVTCVKISNDGKWILTGNEKMEVFLFDGVKGLKVYRFQDEYGPIYSLGFFQKEKYACLGSRFGVTFWDLEKGTKAFTLLNIGGILFFDQNGYFDSDHHSKNYFGFRDKATREMLISMRKYGNSGGELSPFEKILKSKERPGMLKSFLKAENVEMFQQ